MYMHRRLHGGDRRGNDDDDDSSLVDNGSRFVGDDGRRAAAHELHGRDAVTAAVRPSSSHERDDKAWRRGRALSRSAAARERVLALPQPPQATHGATAATTRHAVTSALRGGGGDGHSVTRPAAATMSPSSRRVRGVSEGHRGRSSSSNMSNSHGNVDVQTLLRELVEVSQSIAACLTSTSPQSTPRTRPHDAPSHAQATTKATTTTTTLSAHAIERIVRRVERHFAQRIAALEEDKRVLAVQLHALQQQQQQEATKTSATAAVDDDEHDAARATTATTPSAAPAHAEGACASCADAQAQLTALRRALVAEKAQRLRVEEQTQQLSEQHNRVVATLEQRLQRQEEQLQRLVAAAMAHEANEVVNSQALPRATTTTPATTAAAAAAATATTPASRRGDDSVSRGSHDDNGRLSSTRSSPMTTPRHYLRQHQRHVQQQQQQQQQQQPPLPLPHTFVTRARSNDTDNTTSRAPATTTTVTTTTTRVPMLQAARTPRAHDTRVSGDRARADNNDKDKEDDVMGGDCHDMHAATAPMTTMAAAAAKAAAPQHLPASPLLGTQRNKDGTDDVASQRRNNSSDTTQTRTHNNNSGDGDKGSRRRGDDDVDAIGVFLDEIAHELRSMESAV